MKQLNYESNPLVAYLNQETLKPGEFGILVGVSQRQGDLNSSFGDRTLPEIAPVSNWIGAASCQRSSFDPKRARRLAGQNRQLCVRIADLWAQALPELLEAVTVRVLGCILASILLRDRYQLSFRRCLEHHVHPLWVQSMSLCQAL